MKKLIFTVKLGILIDNYSMHNNIDNIALAYFRVGQMLTDIYFFYVSKEIW